MDARAPEAVIKIVDSVASSPLIDAVKSSFDDALQSKGKLPPEVFAIPGMSGRKYRLFINNLVERTENARYLEVGSWAGSTLCAAIHGNHVRSLSIDNWSAWGGPNRAFFANVARYCSDKTEVNVLTADFRAVRYDSVGTFNIYLYDGPHERQDQFDALDLTLACLDEQFVFIVDDWNWERVRNGTAQAIGACGLSVLFQAEIRTSLDDTHPKVAHKWSDWHNGYFISVLQKKSPASTGIR